MNNCQTMRSYKIPFKRCRDSIIDDSLVTVNLSIEWPMEGGDEPHLIINITNKIPTTPPIQPDPSSAYVNSSHHQNLSDTPSHYYYPSNMNTVQSTAAVIRREADQNGLASSSTTTSTTAVYNPHPIPRQRIQSPIAIEQIKADLRSDLFPLAPQQTYPTDQDIIHTPPNSIEHAGYDTNTLTSNLSIVTTSMPTVISPYHDPLTSPTRTHNPQNRFLLCICPNPTNHHIPNCPINSMNSSGVHINPMQFRPASSAVQSKPFPFLPNTIKTFDSSSVTAISCQQPIYSTNYLPPIPQMVMNNQSNPQNNLWMPMGEFEEIEKKPRKKQHIRRKNSLKNEPTPSDSSTRDTNIFNNQNSIEMSSVDHLYDQKVSPKKVSTSNSSSRESSPIIIQPETVPLFKTDNPSSNSMNDMKASLTAVKSPPTTSSVRSPVELDIPVTQIIDQTKVDNEAIDQIIDGVVHGQGKIILDHQRTRKSSMSSSHSRRQPNGTKLPSVSSPTNPKQTSTTLDTENATKRIRPISVEDFNGKRLTNSHQDQHWPPMDEYNLNPSPFDSLIQARSEVQVIQPEHTTGMSLDRIFSSGNDELFGELTPLSLPLSSTHYSSDSARTNDMFSEPLTQDLLGLDNSPNKSNIYKSFLPYSSTSTWETSQLTSSTVSNSQGNHVISTQSYSQTELYTETNRQAQTFKESLTKTISSMKTNVNIRTTKSTKIIKAKTRLHPTNKQMKCTRCGRTNLIDITSYEFPKKKGLIYECTGCGNNSIQSNVSPEERRQRLAKVAADHLNTVECQFCHRMFHSHHDYIVHLKDDHQSDKPIKRS